MTILSLGFWQFVMINAGIFAVFSLGLQLQYGHTGLLNFGHIAFMAIGAYTMALSVTIAGLPLWVGMLISLVVAMAFGLLVGIPTLRLRADYLAITTIAFSEIIRFVILNEKQVTGGPQGLLGFGDEFRTFHKGVDAFVGSMVGIEFGRDRVLLSLVWLTFIILFLLLNRLVKSPWGRILRAVREDEDAANALGKNPFAFKLQSMAIGSGIAAIGGWFFALNLLFLHPSEFQPLFTFFAWVIILLAGTGRNGAVAFGSIIFSVIFAGTRFFDFWPLSLLAAAQRGALRLVIIGLILIGLMAFRPQGLFGRREELLLEG